MAHRRSLQFATRRLLSPATTAHRQNETPLSYSLCLLWRKDMYVSKAKKMLIYTVI